MWLLSSGKETGEDGNLILINLCVTSHMCLANIVLDNTEEKSTLTYTLAHKTH